MFAQPPLKWAPNHALCVYAATRHCQLSCTKILLWKICYRQQRNVLGSSCEVPILSSNFNQLWSLEIFSWSPQYQISRTQVQWEQRWYMRTKGHEETNRRLLWLCERAHKPSENSWSGLRKLFTTGKPQYSHRHKFEDRMLIALNRHLFQTDRRANMAHC